MYREEAVTPINPKHYRNHPSGVECIDVIRHFPFSQGNAIKYLWRAGDKGGPEKLKEDLNKAMWYVIDSVKNEAYENMYNNCWWATDKYFENVEKWSESENPGHRKQAIYNLLIGRLTDAIKHIEAWLSLIDK